MGAIKRIICFIFGHKDIERDIGRTYYNECLRCGRTK